MYQPAPASVPARLATRPSPPPVCLYLGMLALLLAGCGRFGYDAQNSANDVDAAEPTLTPDASAPDSRPVDASIPVNAVDVRVTENLDDGMIVGDQIYESGQQGIISAGVASAGTAWMYIRMRLPEDIPPGTRIHDAYLSLKGAGNTGWDPAVHALLIYADEHKDPKEIKDAREAPDSGEPMAHKLTTASVRWPEAGGLAWDDAGVNITPSLVPLLEEQMGRHSGLWAGDHVMFWLRGEPGAAPALVGAYDVASDNDNQVVGVIEIVID